MLYRKALIVCLLCGFCFSGFGQNKCTHKVDLLAVKAAPNATMRVELKVEGTGRFEGQLLSISPSGENVAKTFSGMGAERVTLDELNQNLQYKVVVAFPEEQKFLCKTKVVPDISLQRDLR